MFVQTEQSGKHFTEINNRKSVAKFDILLIEK